MDFFFEIGNACKNRSKIGLKSEQRGLQGASNSFDREDRI